MTVESFIIDGETYLILNTATINHITYYYLANKNKEKFYKKLIRKQDPNDPDSIIPLDNEEELQKASLQLINSIIS